MMASRSQAGAALAWAAAWQVAPTRDITMGAVTSGRTAPTDWARRSSVSDGVAQCVLHLGGGHLEVHAGAHHGHQQVPLGRPLLDDVLEEAEEGGGRVVGLGQRPGVEGERREPLEQDGLAELLLGGEMPVERPHAHPGLLGDGVDGDLYPLGREQHLCRLEDAGPVALGVGPQRARRVGAGCVAPRRRLRRGSHENLSLPVDKRNSGSV